MTATGEDAVMLLRSIDATLKQLLALSQQRRGAQAPTRASAPSKAIADDADLDSKYGDEQIRFSPRDWSGDDYKGRRMSECPSAFLELLADSYAYFAAKNEASGAVTDSGKPKADYDRRSERRARGWAARNRTKPQAAAPAPDGMWSTSEWEDAP